MRKIIFFKTASGQSPIEDFLDQLPAKSAQKVAWVLQLVEDLDRVPSKYFKKLVTPKISGRLELLLDQTYLGWLDSLMAPK